LRRNPARTTIKFSSQNGKHSFLWKIPIEIYALPPGYQFNDLAKSFAGKSEPLRTASKDLSARQSKESDGKSEHYLPLTNHKKSNILSHNFQLSLLQNNVESFVTH